MNLRGAASTAIRDLLTGPAQPARVLGIENHGVYLGTRHPHAVIGLVAEDAVHLPCAVVLPVSSRQVPLPETTQLRATSASPVMIGRERISWPTPRGPARIVVDSWWSPPNAPRGTPMSQALDQLAEALAAVDIGIAPNLTQALAQPVGERKEREVAGRLLGRGPGLTPSGDDVLAGYLAGCHAFGVPAAGVRDAVLEHAPQMTTTLSAQLLGNAVRDELIPQVVDLLHALLGQRPLGPAQEAQLRVGHTSGAAMAVGILLAGRRATG